MEKVWEGSGYLSLQQGERKRRCRLPLPPEEMGKMILDLPSHFSRSIWSQKPALLEFWIHTSEWNTSEAQMAPAMSTGGVIRRALYWSLPLPLLVQGYSSFWHTRKFPPSGECKWKGNGCHSLIEVLRGRMRSLTPLFPLSWSWEHGWDEASSWGLAWLTWRS